MDSYPGDSKAKARVPPTRLSALADEDLVESIAGGCHDSLAILFDRHYRLVLGIASTVLRDPVEAEDVLQTVFLEVCRVAGLFDRSKGKAKTWLIRYAHHRSLDRLRQLKLRGYYDPAGGNERQRATENSSGGPLQGWNSLELSRMLEEAFAALTADQRTTLQLAFVEGRTMREIAEQLGATFTSVRHHYYRGLQKLRCFLTEQITPSRVEHGSEEESPYV